MTKRFFKGGRFAAVVIYATLFLSLNVSAATVFTGNAIGSFSNPAFTDWHFDYTRNRDGDSTPGSTSDFNWGIGYDYYDQRITSSSFVFDGTGSDPGTAPFSVVSGEAFVLGSFIYTNEKTVLSGGTVLVDFTLDVNINGAAIDPAIYSIGIDNTPNTTGDPGLDADFAWLDTMPDPVTFSLDSNSYFLSILGFSRDGGLTFETSTYLDESDSTLAQIYAEIVPVPVPAAIWLFGSGLIGIFCTARRRR